MKRQEANIYEIAIEAGVSIATVSRVMNQNAAVSEKSRQKVLAAVEKLNYVPNGTARNLSKSSSNLVGVVVPDINNPFFSSLLQGVTRAADEKGLHVFLFSTDESTEREHQVLTTMREHRMCGIIIAPVSERDTQTLQQLTNFEARGIPVVLIDREIGADRFDRVVTDDEDGVYRAVTTLIKEGHRKIAIITGPDASRPGRERMKGYMRAMEEYEVPVLSEYVREGDFKADRAWGETLALMALPEPPSAILSSNNMTTYGCLRAFSQLGLKVGKDIALIGFDDIDALKWLNYDISVVNRDVPFMGEHAMRLLMRRIEADATPSQRTRVILPTELILRGSERLNTET
ncbi:MAG: LacI family transcriptional regulator [Ruminococcaceae bacterium]|nr:LacI family transcriptional regulator [Oscillospiraceae bacterium]